MTHLTRIFGRLGRILGVCPHCNELFYLSEARAYLAGGQPHSIVDGLRAAERRLDLAEDNLRDFETKFRQAAARAGLRKAKKLLREIDPVFSGAGHDPQDVKVIFNPIRYVIFNGLARNHLKEIELVASASDGPAGAQVQKSIGRALASGNIEFRTLRVDRNGQLHSE